MRIRTQLTLAALFCTSMVSAYAGAITYRTLNGDPAEYPARYSDFDRHNLTKFVRSLHREFRMYGNFNKKH